MLYADFLNNTSLPVHKMMHYFLAYERHFGKFVNHPMKFLEIGAGNGGSSQMWKKWFGPAARIVAIDINPVCKRFEDEQVAVRLGDQSDSTFLQSVIDEFGQFDAVLDDGSHRMSHIMASMNYLYPRISPNGVYMIEDIHTSYWEQWGGGLRKPGTVVEFFKDALDRLNADHVREGGIQSDEFTKSTLAMTAYDSVFVFEKTSFLNKANKMIGDESLRINY